MKVCLFSFKGISSDQEYVAHILSMRCENDYEDSGTATITKHSSLRKHAYSNILKISPSKTENFQIKNSDIFHISAQKHRLWVLVRTASMGKYSNLLNPNPLRNPPICLSFSTIPVYSNKLYCLS